ncbi:hypothetical protein Tco_1027534, partial [Tanacetum coccineum]
VALSECRTDKGDTNDIPTVLREVEEEIGSMGSCSFSLHDLQCSLLCVFAEHQGTTHALWKRTLIKARHFNGQGQWPAKFAKFIFDLLKNDESNAEESLWCSKRGKYNNPKGTESKPDKDYNPNH